MWNFIIIKDQTERIWAHAHLLAFLQGQRLPDVGNIIEWLQLRHARAQHHGEQVDEEIGMLPDGQVGFIAHLLEPGQREYFLTCFSNDCSLQTVLTSYTEACVGFEFC